MPTKFEIANATGCANCHHSFYSHSQDYSNKWHCQKGCDCTGYISETGGRENASKSCECGHTYAEHDSKDEKGDPLACNKCKCDAFYTVQKNSTAWPKAMKCSFIEPGVVMYADVGMVLVQKPALDKMMNSMRGKPVVNTDHRDVSPEDFTNGNFDGIVDGNDASVWFDSTDAKYHCSFQVTTPATLQNIKNGFKVSCAYKVTKWGPGGIHNNVPYEREVLDGEYTHLAIVANPRYEGVRIYNNKGAKTMTLKWIKKLLGQDGKELENSVEIESSKSIVEVEGKEVPMDELINAFKAEEEQKQKALENQAPKLTDVIDLGNGKKATVQDLVNAYKAKNAEEEDEKKKKEAKEKEDRENAAAAQLKNDMEKDHKDGKHDDKEKENCGMCNAIKNANGKSHFERVEDEMKNRKDIFTDELPEHFDGIAAGKSRFGSEPATAGKK